MTNSENNKRIAKNTLILYFRMLFTMGISLYTSRVVLNTLGVEDFGIYNVVGGVVAMFSILSGSLSAAISRFITFELGKGNKERLNSIFSVSVTIQISLALIVFILAESVGLWFLNTKMNISADRMQAANWVFQCSILTFMVNLISIPYNATIIAHERMKAFAYISILEAFLKLAVVFLLFISVFDKLAFYAVMLLIIAIIIRLTYGIYCKRNFQECIYHFSLDKHIFKEISSFAGWNFIGASSFVLRDQGVNIAINLLCGSAINAARGIAMQANGAIYGFVNNFMTALNPQITKSYSSGEYKYMLVLIQQGSRLSFYLLLFLSLPVLIETEYILSLWLVNVPAHTVTFLRLALIFALTDSLSGTLITTMLATGNIRRYQIIVGGLQLMNLPISYVLLYVGFFPEITMIVAIFISLLCLIARLWLLKEMINFPIQHFLSKVLGNITIVSILSAIIPYIYYINTDAGWIRFLFTTSLCLIMTTIIIYFIGCSKEEKYFLNLKIAQIYSQFYRNDSYNR